MFQQISSNKPCKKKQTLISSLKRAKLKTGFWLGFNLSFLRVWNYNDVLRFFKFRFITYTIYTHARSFYSRSNATSLLFLRQCLSYCFNPDFHATIRHAYITRDHVLSRNFTLHISMWSQPDIWQVYNSNNMFPWYQTL